MSAGRTHAVEKPWPSARRRASWAYSMASGSRSPRNRACPYSAKSASDGEQEYEGQDEKPADALGQAVDEVLNNLHGMVLRMTLPAAHGWVGFRGADVPVRRGLLLPVPPQSAVQGAAADAEILRRVRAFVPVLA